MNSRLFSGGAESGCGKLSLINAWPVPRVLMLQPDKRKSDRGKEGKRGGEEERRDCGRTQEKEGKRRGDKERKEGRRGEGRVGGKK